MDRCGKRIPTILTSEQLRYMKRDGISVKQPVFWDFLSNPKKRIFLQYLQQTNLDLKEERPSQLIVFYTVSSRQQLSTLQSLFQSIGYEKVLVVPEFLLFIPITNTPRLFDGYLAVFDVFESSFNIHIYHNLTPCFDKKAYNISIKKRIINRMISAIDKKACASGLPPLSNMEINQVIPLIVDNLLCAFSDNQKLEFHWLVNEEQRMVEFDHDTFETMFIEVLSDVIYSVLASFGITYKQIKRYMVNGHSLFSESVRGSLFSIFRGAVPAEWYLGIGLQKTIVDIIRNPKSYDPNRGNQLPSMTTKTSSSICVSPGLHWKRVHELIGNTVLSDHHTKSSVSMCIYRLNMESLCMKINYDRLTYGQLEEDHSYIEGILPKCFANGNEDRTDTVVTIGPYRDCHFNGLCLKQYINSPIRWEGILKNDVSEGSGRALINHQLVWRGTYKENEIEGMGECWTNNGDMYIGEFSNGMYDGYGCLVSENQEMNDGLFVGGEWNGYQHLGNAEMQSCGIVNDNTWNGRVIRVLNDGCVLMCSFRQGILDGKVLWMNREGDVCDSLVQNEHIMERKYSRKGIEESCVVCQPQRHYVRDTVVPDEEVNTFVEATQSEEEGSDDDQWIRCVDRMNMASITDDMIKKTFYEHFPVVADGGPEVKQVSEPSENEYRIIPNTSLQFHENWHFKFELPGSENTGTGTGCLLTEKDQIVYMGNFKEWQFNGKGVLFYTNGRKQYEGIFAGNVLHGEGIWYYPNGCVKYSGMWESGELNGPGSLYRLVDLQYCNSIYRRFLLMRGGRTKYISFGGGYNPSMFAEQCPH